jgi:hypothetical protein
MDTQPRFAAAALQNLARDILAAAGTPREAASIWAETLVWANLRGVDSHGVMRVPRYLEQIAKGAFTKTISERTPVLQFDHGHHPVVGSMPLGQITKLREDAKGIGPIRLCTVTGPGDLVYYGIHALSMAYAVLGAGVVSAHNTGREGAHIVRLRREDECDIVLMVGAREKMRAAFSIQLFGEKGTLRVEPDLKDLYAYLLDAFLDLVLRDHVSVPVAEEVELIAALEAGQKSLEFGREVKLGEVG